MNDNHLQLALRWIHLVAGVTWIGHLYFFNFVNVPFVKTMDADTKKKVVPELMPRALWWFRWGAMITFLSGLAFLWLKYFKMDTTGSMGFQGPQGLLSVDAGRWITFGAILGTIMWFNVWFIIWPIQKRVIAGVKGTGPAVDAGVIRKAFLASRANTYLSVPMLFGMAAGSHEGLMKFSPLAVGIATFAGFAVAYVLIEVISPKAGTGS